MRRAAHSPRQNGAPSVRPAACSSECCRMQPHRQRQHRRRLQCSLPSTRRSTLHEVHLRSAASSSTTASSSTIIVRAADNSSSSSLNEVLALDVEYVHLQQKQTRFGGGRISIHPAEVCLAAPGGAIAFHSFCHPGDEAVAGAHYVGGVREASWVDALPTAEVLAQVQAQIAGRRVVGHGLGKDLAALGIAHPRELQVDTVACRAFQSPGGQARTLSVLTQQLLGRSIRTGAVHSAREDALAILELYLGSVAGDTSQMDAQGLQQHELEEILAHARRAGV